MKTRSLVVLTTLITLLVFAVACNKHNSIRTITDIQKTGVQSADEYNLLRSVTPTLPDISNDLVFKNNQLIGIVNLSNLTVLPFNEFSTVLNTITGNHGLYFDLDTDKPMPYAECYQSSNKEIDQNTKVKIHRVPDCNADPKICPCVNTDMDASCIELPK